MKSGQLRVLFVCSRNQWRSPTAERIWRRDARFSVRSAGTSSSAAHPLSHDDVVWADVIFVMEDKHAQRVRATFGQAAAHTKIVVLDIEDEYRLMDPALVELLTEHVSPVLEALLTEREGLAPRGA